MKDKKVDDVQYDDELDRFVDTSWRIHRQWAIRGELRDAFPSVQSSDALHLPNGTANGSSAIATVSTDQPDANSAEVAKEIEDTIYSRVNNGSPNGDSNNNHDLKNTIRYSSENRDQMPNHDIKGGSSPFGLDLNYITESIISLSAKRGTRARVQDLIRADHMLRAKHGPNYLIFDLQSENYRTDSSPSITDSSFIVRCGWKVGLAPGLEKLCSVCKQLEKWLASDDRRVAVIYSGDDILRLECILRAYMQYISICGSRSPNRENRDLDLYAMQRFLDDRVGSQVTPSNQRYVNYFAGLLSGEIKMNAQPLFLTHISVPVVLDYKSYETDVRSPERGSRLFFKIYEGLRHVHTTGIYHTSPESYHHQPFVVVNTHGLRLRGDILIRCYHSNGNFTEQNGACRNLNGEFNRSLQKKQRSLVFSVQFHTCAAAGSRTMRLEKRDLDVACIDKRFPEDASFILHFVDDITNVPNDEFIKHDVIFEPQCDVTAWDSVEDLVASPVDMLDLNQPHTTGPLDGSLYATVANKKQQVSYHITEQHHTNQGLANNAGGKRSVTSPLTVSMDSGISTTGQSSGHSRHQTTTTNFSTVNTSTPTNNYRLNSACSENSSSQVSQPSPAEDKHRELDELLRDMMSNVRNIPDLRADKSPPSVGDSRSGGGKRVEVDYERQRQQSESNANRERYHRFEYSGYNDESNPNIPYHAREDSEPFSYGLVPGNRQDLTTYNHQSYQRSINDDNYTQRVTSPYTNGEQRPGSAAAIRTVSSDYNNQRSASALDDRYQSQNSTLRRPGSSTGNYPGQDIPSEHSTLTRQGTSSYPSAHSTLTRSYSDSVTRTSVPADILKSDQELQNAAIMIRMHPGLSSPSLVRKITGNTGDYSATSDAYASSSDYEGPSTPKKQEFNLNGTSKYDRQLSDDVFTNKYSTMMTRSNTDGALRTRSYSLTQNNANVYKPSFNSLTDSPIQSPTSNPTGLTWLQMQQQKLLLRKQGREIGRTNTYNNYSTNQRSFNNSYNFGSEFNYGKNSRHNRPSASHRADGYTSDTTAFADDDEDWSIPIHVQTTRSVQDSPDLPHRTSSRKYHTLTNKFTTSGTSTMSPNNGYNKIVSENYKMVNSDNKNERPFVAVKRQHEMNKKMGYSSSGSLNRKDELDSSGLLSFVEKENVSPSRKYMTTKKEEYIMQTTSSPGSVSSRPETPAFPVAPRTPYFGHNSQHEHSHALQQQQQSNQRKEYQFQQREYQQSKEYQQSREFQQNQASEHKQHFFGESFQGEKHVSRSGGTMMSRNTSGDLQASLPPKSPLMQRRDQYSTETLYNTGFSNRDNNSTITRRAAHFDNSAMQNEIIQEVSQANVKFARDISKFWYKPHISREDVIALLRHRPPGTFIIRDSNSFPGAYGLAMKVAVAPKQQNGSSPGSQPGDELVRHFLIEPTARGVRLKGCNDEPAFGSLSALVYQHSLTPLALPCALLLPDKELTLPHKRDDASLQQHEMLFAQGAACNVLYLFSCDTESLTGPQAVRKAVSNLFASRPLPTATAVHFKVSTQGITLTDISRSLFFRKHYRSETISHCGLDPDNHMWSIKPENGDTNTQPISINRIFAFVARKSGPGIGNQCHVFCELEPHQPANAIVEFVHKALQSVHQHQQHNSQQQNVVL